MDQEIKEEIITDIEQAIQEDVDKQNAIENRSRFESNITNLWGHSATGIEAKKAAMTMLSTKIGLYARIPLVCKADDCPYCDSCMLLPYDLAPRGEICPVEAASIEVRYANYNDQFELDESSFTDKCLVSELINLDIMSDRCKALISKEGVPVVDVVAGVTEQGDEYTQPQISKYYEVYEKTLKRREEILQLMMGTRKDKKDEGKKEKDIVDIIREMEQNGGFVIDEKPNNIIDVEVK